MARTSRFVKLHVRWAVLVNSFELFWKYGGDTDVRLLPAHIKRTPDCAPASAIGLFDMASL